MSVINYNVPFRKIHARRYDDKSRAINIDVIDLVFFFGQYVKRRSRNST